jgi:hypothetical protein
MLNSSAPKGGQRRDNLLLAADHAGQEHMLPRDPAGIEGLLDDFLITQENEASLAFHKKLGYETKVLFENCGFKMGRWLGVYWLEKRLKTVETPNSFPTSFPRLRQDEQRFSDILYKLSLS